MTDRDDKRSTKPADATDLGYVSTRDVLIRCGMELLTERGFAGTGLEAVLQRTGIPKGSFYHHFRSKDGFGVAVLQAYDAYFQRKLDRWLLDDATAPLLRIRHFVDDAKRGMARHQFTRGCLVGNFGQELSILPPNYRDILNGILDRWAERVRACLELAQQRGDIAQGADCHQLAEFFWIGWEGAVMRSRMTQSAEPMETFIQAYLGALASRPASEKKPRIPRRRAI